MIQVKYGLLPQEMFCNYFDFLIGKTFKILPMKEEGNKTLKLYLESFQRELIGNQQLFTYLIDEPRFISVLSSIQFLINENYSTDICRKEVFKCIHILEDIKTSIRLESD